MGLTGLVALRRAGSSPTRDQTHVSCTSRQIPHHGATRKSPLVKFWFLSLAIFCFAHLPSSPDLQKLFTYSGGRSFLSSKSCVFFHFRVLLILIVASFLCASYSACLLFIAASVTCYSTWRTEEVPTAVTCVSVATVIEPTCLNDSRQKPGSPSPSRWRTELQAQSLPRK